MPPVQRPEHRLPGPPIEAPTHYLVSLENLIYPEIYEDEAPWAMVAAAEANRLWRFWHSTPAGVPEMVPVDAGVLARLANACSLIHIDGCEDYNCVGHGGGVVLDKKRLEFCVTCQIGWMGACLDWLLDQRWPPRQDSWYGAYGAPPADPRPEYERRWRIIHDFDNRRNSA